MMADRKILCCLCSRESESSEALEAHISSHHLNYIPYRCKHCSCACPTEHFICIHMEKSHPGMQVETFYQPNAALQAELMKFLYKSEKKRNQNNRWQIIDRRRYKKADTFGDAARALAIGSPASQDEGNTTAPRHPPTPGPLPRAESFSDVEILEVVKKPVGARMTIQPPMLRTGKTKRATEMKKEVRKRKNVPAEKKKGGENKPEGKGEAKREKLERNPPTVNQGHKVVKSEPERAKQAARGELEISHVECMQCHWYSFARQLSHKITHIFQKHVDKPVIFCHYCSYVCTGSLGAVRAHIRARHPHGNKSHFVDKREAMMGEVNVWLRSCFPDTEPVTEGDLRSEGRVEGSGGEDGQIPAERGKISRKKSSRRGRNERDFP